MFGKKETSKKLIKHDSHHDDKGRLIEHKERMKMLEFMNTTSKCLIWFFSINAVLWIWCSYILAFIGQPQIAESLSSNVCIVCIGQMVTYFITKTVENVFRYNNFGGRSTYEEEKEHILDNINIPAAQVPEIKNIVYQNDSYERKSSTSDSKPISLNKSDDYIGEVNDNEEFSTDFN